MQALSSCSTPNKALKSHLDRWRQAGFILHPPGILQGNARITFVSVQALPCSLEGCRHSFTPWVLPSAASRAGEGWKQSGPWGALREPRAGAALPVPHPPHPQPPPSIRNTATLQPGPAPGPGTNGRVAAAKESFFFIDGTQARLTAHLYFSASTLATADMNLSTAECTSGL